MHTWNRSDLWADADARIARRARIWETSIALFVMVAWGIPTVARGAWDFVSLLDLAQPFP